MMKRATICIGVDHAGTMPALQAAAKGAREFADWASAQGCETQVLVDSPSAKVALTDVYDAVESVTKTRAYDQLVVYFSGHGILSAPGTEFWLLSRAPENPNEAVNVFRSIEDARNSGIPHVVFVSDACRSSAKGLPLSGVSGGTIFPNAGYSASRSKVDVFYATRPGDPAWEVPVEKSTQNYRGLFTDFVLSTVKSPDARLVENVTDGASQLMVVSSHKLEVHLETMFVDQTAEVDIRIRQRPEARVESNLPLYFATVNAADVLDSNRFGAGRGRPRDTIDVALGALGESAGFRDATKVHTPRAAALAERVGLAHEVKELTNTRGRRHYETTTGFTVHGARGAELEARGWDVDPAFREQGNDLHLRMHHGTARSRSAVLAFTLESGVERGALLPVFPGFIGSVVVDAEGRVVNVSFVPSRNTSRYADYSTREADIETMRAFAAVAAKYGRFEVPAGTAAEFASRVRVEKALDPTLGVYAAYAYAQAGAYGDVASVFGYMRDDPDLPVPFDVALLATRYPESADMARRARVAPFAPMLSQGWALLARGDALYDPIHDELRPHLVPSLWTTLDRAGVDVARNAIRSERFP